MKQMDSNLLMSLDISTSNVGVSLFGMDGKLLKLSNLCPIIKNVEALPQEKLHMKAQLILDHLENESYLGNVTKIVIEEPLKDSMTPDVAAMLNFFAGQIYYGLRQRTTVIPEYLHIDECRRFGLPELVATRSKKDVLFGSVPLQIGTQKLKDYRKLIIMSLVAQRFPDIVWLLNNNLRLDDKNFDRSDSVVVALGYMQKNGFWEPDPKSVDFAVQLVTENIKYEQYTSDLMKNKNLSKDERDQLKYKYLKEVYNIEKYLNVAI